MRWKREESRNTFQARINELEEENRKLGEALEDAEKGHATADATLKSVTTLRAVERASVENALQEKNKTIQALSKQLVKANHALKEARKPQPDEWN